MSGEARTWREFDEEAVVDMVVGNAPGLFAVVRGQGPDTGAEIVAWGLRLTDWLVVVDLADRVGRRFTSLEEVESGYHADRPVITVQMEAPMLLRTLLQEPARLSEHWRSAELERSIAESQV